MGLGIGTVVGGGWGAAAVHLTETRAIVGDDKPFDPSPWLALCDKIALMGADHFSARLPQGKWICWDKSLGMGPHTGFSDAEFGWIRKANPRRNVYRHLWCGIMADKRGEGLPGKGKAIRRVHVSQKPLGLMRFLIEHLKLKPGSVVLDPFMGSGSTGVAALSLGMRFVGVEIEERHFETACQRIQSWVESGGVTA